MAGSSVDRAIGQIVDELDELDDAHAISLLDVGVGTGRFCARLRQRSKLPIFPYGLDLSERMVDIAGRRIPDLVTSVGDAADLSRHFPGRLFGLAATHFVTGYVPIAAIATMVHSRLEPGGYWSFVGGTKRAFPELQRTGDTRVFRRMFRFGDRQLDDVIINPADRAEVVQAMENAGFSIRRIETYHPPVRFRDLDEFLEFGYTGGWLTPFVEHMGLHQANRLTRAFLNRFVFPIHDHHEVEIVLAQKSR